MLKKITDFTYEETKELLRRNAKLREVAKAQTYQFMNGFVDDYLAYVKGSCIYTRGETSISDFKVLEYRSFIYDLISCDEEMEIFDSTVKDDVRWLEEYFQEHSGYSLEAVNKVEAIAKWFEAMLNAEYDDLDHPDANADWFLTALDDNDSQYEHLVIDTETYEAYLPLEYASPTQGEAEK